MNILVVVGATKNKNYYNGCSNNRKVVAVVVEFVSVDAAVVSEMIAL